jgi:hypothetical protein
MRDTIKQYVCDKGGLFVAAAGNNGLDMTGTTKSYPGAYVTDPLVAPCILPVAAVDQYDRWGAHVSRGCCQRLEVHALADHMHAM